MTCLAHRCAERVIKMLGVDDWYFQTQEINDSGTRQWSFPSYQRTELMTCDVMDGHGFCRAAEINWYDGISVHVAPYRGGVPSTLVNYVAWSDLDTWTEAASGLPFWPSRAVEPKRGVVLIPMFGNTPHRPRCTFYCAWKCWNRKLGGDPSAAHSKHTFRLPGLSAVKNAKDVGGDWYVKRCEEFLWRWNDCVIPSVHVDEPKKIRRWEPRPGMTGVLHPAMLDLAKRAWTVGNRHTAAVGYAGVIRLAGFPEEVAEKLITEMCAEMGDDEVSERLAQVRQTYKIPMSQVAGVSILRELVLES